tara:strand:+ start:56 stop:382 length:327 start_codon:yes stop_codon:yes gene_type:complete
MSYYNTTHLAGTKLKKEKLQALTQNTQILHVFRGDDTLARTPFDVQETLKDEYDLDYPITSIRRSITNLTNDRYLVKTRAKSRGKYGKFNYTWMTAEGYEQIKQKIGD